VKESLQGPLNSAKLRKIAGIKNVFSRDWNTRKEDAEVTSSGSAFQTCGAANYWSVNYCYYYY